MPPDPAHDLVRTYRIILFSGFALLLVLFTALIVREYQSREAQEIELQRRSAQTRLAEIEAIVDAANKHVSQMLALAELAWASSKGQPDRDDPRLHSDALAIRSGDAVVLRDAAALRARQESGQELRLIDALLPLQMAAHRVTPFFAWSYFFSAGRDLIVIYPWAPEEQLLGPGPDQLDMFRGYFNYDLYRLTEQGLNPDRSAKWTPVYVDAGGQGLMVSHSAPVDADGRQIGIVGTDVRLALLSERLAHPLDLLALVDEAGTVVADSRNRAATAGGTTAFADLTGFQLKPSPADGAWQQDANVLLSLPVQGAPWRLIKVIPVRELQYAAFQQILPYLGFLAALAATFVLLHVLVARNYVRPALGLVGLVSRLAKGHPDKDEPFPAAWQPWIQRIRTTFQDLTSVNRQLVAARAKSDAIIAVALDAVVTVDAQLRVVDFNPAAERMFGYPFEAARGRPVGDLIVPDHLRPAHEQGVRRYERTREPHVLGRRVELEAKRADGTQFPIELQIHELPGDTGVRYTAYIRDLTDQKRAAAENAAQQAKLYQAEKLSAMGSLLAGVAHELNNPLAVVIAHATLLEELAADDATLDRSVIIREAAERCGRIVRTFLSMARQQEPKRAPTSFPSIVDQALAVVGYGLRTAGITVTTELDETLPEIMADPDQLTQVVLNLLINAQQALADRQEAKGIWIRSGVRGPGQLFLSVADNGPGVPDDIKATIFEPFFTTKAVGVGTGVGLAISANIVRAHGGTVELGDRPGGGAVFSLLLPMPEGAAGLMEEPAPVPTTRPGHCILVVDDEPSVADALAGFIRLCGHEACTAQTVDRAIATIGRRSVDAVFCDLRMPDGGAPVLYERLVTLHSDLHERFVFVTGDLIVGPSAISAVGRGEATRVLEKPFSLNDVQARLAEVLVSPQAEPARS